MGIVALTVPYAIIGGFTGFQNEGSTKAQRAWTMSWLVLGQVLGVYAGIVLDM